MLSPLNRIHSATITWAVMQESYHYGDDGKKSPNSAGLTEASPTEQLDG
jgi:hypothetical protein